MVQDIEEVEIDWLRDDETGFEFRPPLDIDDILDYEEVEEGDVGFSRFSSTLPYSVPVQICVPAHHFKEAEIYIEDAGLEFLSDAEEIPYNQFMVSEVRTSDPVSNKSYRRDCNMTKTMTATRLNNRLDKAQDRLRQCQSDDFDCKKLWAKKVRFYIDKLRTFPKFSGQKCFCGRMELLQGELARERWRKNLLEEWESLDYPYQKREFLEKADDFGIRGELFEV